MQASGTSVWSLRLFSSEPKWSAFRMTYQAGLAPWQRSWLIAQSSGYHSISGNRSLSYLLGYGEPWGTITSSAQAWWSCSLHLRKETCLHLLIYFHPASFLEQIINLFDAEVFIWVAEKFPANGIKSIYSRAQKFWEWQKYWFSKCLLLQCI